MVKSPPAMRLGNACEVDSSVDSEASTMDPLCDAKS